MGVKLPAPGRMRVCAQSRVRVTEDSLLDYLRRFDARLRASGASDWSRISWVGYARCVIAYAIEMGWVRTRPLPVRLPAQPRRPAGMQPQEIAAVFRELERSPHRRRVSLILRFIAATGCRPSEACNLRWSDVDLGAGVCRLAAHKSAKQTGAARMIYLTAPAAMLLAGLERSAEVVFPSRRGERFTPAGLRCSWRRAFDAAFPHAPMQRRGPYRLRHSFAQAAVEVLPLQELAGLMGHRSLATTQRYYAMRDARLVAAASRVSPPVPQPAREQMPAADAAGRSGYQVPKRPGKRRATPRSRGRAIGGRRAAGPARGT